MPATDNNNNDAMINTTFAPMPQAQLIIDRIVMSLQESARPPIRAMANRLLSGQRRLIDLVNTRSTTTAGHVPRSARIAFALTHTDKSLMETAEFSALAAEATAAAEAYQGIIRDVIGRTQDLGIAAQQRKVADLIATLAHDLTIVHYLHCHKQPTSDAIKRAAMISLGPTQEVPVFGPYTTEQLLLVYDEKYDEATEIILTDSTDNDDDSDDDAPPAPVVPPPTISTLIPTFVSLANPTDDDVIATVQWVRCVLRELSQDVIGRHTKVRDELALSAAFKKAKILEDSTASAAATADKLAAELPVTAATLAELVDKKVQAALAKDKRRPKERAADSSRRGPARNRHPEQQKRKPKGKGKAAEEKANDAPNDTNKNARDKTTGKKRKRKPAAKL